jgi:putative transposase
MLINKAYKFRFYPNTQQRQQLAVDFGCARFVWNTALDARSFAYRVLSQQVTSIDCSRAMTELKQDPDYAWLFDANSTVLAQALRDQDRAFQNFFAGRASYPKFKKKHHAQSIRYQLDQRQIARTYNPATGLLKLPKLGVLKLTWSQGVAGIPKMATVTKDSCGRYFISFSCEVEVMPLPSENQAIGVDTGLASIATLSDGTKFDAPRYIRRYARRLKLAQRVMARRVKGSRRWHKARQRVAKLQARIAACRQWFLHDLSTGLIRNFGLIAMEDLHIKALCRALRLGKSMADAALGELVRQIEYKAHWYGREVIKIGRYDRSTGVCPTCGTVGPKLALRIRQWRCECGAAHDRDVAAAQVILNRATAERAGVARGAAYQPAVVV